MAEKDRPELDFDNQQGEQKFCTFIKGLPQKPENTLRLFERSNGDFYSVHGEDAFYIAQNVYKTSSVVKYLGGDAKKGLPSCTISRLMAETFLRDALLNKQMKIEIWGGEPRKNIWRIVKRASPGNLQDLEDLLFTNVDMAASPIVIAVKLASQRDHKIVGVAFADATIRELGVSEFVDNELYSNFESLVIQLGVKECIVPADEAQKDYELLKLRGVLEKCGVVMTERRKSDFTSKDVEQDLNRLLEEEISVSNLPEFELKNAMCACACLIKYLSLLTDESNFGNYRLSLHDLSQYMKLDAAALRALNLFPGPQDGSNKSMSLYGLLNKCKTAQGSRLLSQWLKQPLIDLADIERRQNLVSIFVEDTELRQSLREDNLRNIPDLHRLAKRFQKGIASLQDVVRVYQVVIRLPGLINVLDSYEPIYESRKELVEEAYISKLKKHAESLEKLQEMVETTIDLEAIENHEFMIKADFDETLLAIRTKLDEIMREMSQEHQRVGDKLDMELDKKLHMEKQNVYGYCFRLTRNDASCLRGAKSFIELTTQRNGVYFTTGKMKSLSSAFTELSEEYEKKQINLVKDVINIAATYCPTLEVLNGVLAHLDVIVSFALVAVQAPITFVRPKMATKGCGNVILKAARHPCLEVQDDVSFIPNDVQLIRGESEFQIITGPNMGGKSTYIRQIGVIALMAQVGSFVPCTEASLCVFDCILARVGAGDNQLKGISTFMAEMLETATILRTATANSLLVIDELGRGTSTSDGFGLAWAISEYIAKQLRCFCLFATHFHELTMLSKDVPTVRNLHVTAHIEKTVSGDRSITLLYKVNEGVCDESFGIHVAELANFPKSVVKIAKKKAEELENCSNDDAMEIDGVETSGNQAEREDPLESNPILNQLFMEIGNDDSEPAELESTLSRLQGIKADYQNRVQNDISCQEMISAVGESE